MHAQFGEPPPCDTCNNPGPLLEENEAAVRIWIMCNKYGRVIGPMGEVGPIKLEVVQGLCRDYGEPVETIEKVLKLEDLLYPALYPKDKV